MPVIQADPIPSTIEDDIFDMTDDECLARLASAVVQEPCEDDSERLDEMARLIARLAVAIE